MGGRTDGLAGSTCSHQPEVLPTPDIQEASSGQGLHHLSTVQCMLGSPFATKEATWENFTTGKPQGFLWIQGTVSSDSNTQGPWGRLLRSRQAHRQDKRPAWGWGRRATLTPAPLSAS